MMHRTPSVIYEDNHLLVVDKPSGLATMGVAATQDSLVKIAKDYLKRKYRKPGNVYLGVVSRLDSLASGVIVLARTSKAAARLAAQFRNGEVTKRYWAIVSGDVQPEEGTLVDWLVKDSTAKRVRVASSESAGREHGLGQRAESRYLVVSRRGDGTLLEIDLRTGRKHQIRVQLATRGWPIAGDRKYGSRQGFPVGIALHAVALRLVHPVRQVETTFRCAPPAGWKLGRFDVDFERATLGLS
jgi:23S rRNA pseudouridine1911/1915/1917 synthase